MMMRLFEGTEWDKPPTCDRCGELESDCTCPPPPEAQVAPAKQTAKLALEKRKKGKLVTVIRGLSAAGGHLEELLPKLKNSCGAGGSVKDETLEIQGDHLERLKTFLQERGYKVR